MAVKNVVQLTTYVKPEVMVLLKELSQATNRSRSQMGSALIEEALRHRGLLNTPQIASTELPTQEFD